MKRYKTDAKIVGSIPTLASPLNQKIRRGGGINFVLSTGGWYEP